VKKPKASNSLSLHCLSLQLLSLLIGKLAITDHAREAVLHAAFLMMRM
jgi:hypothetical protein